jgi:hypothetical protein
MGPQGAQGPAGLAQTDVTPVMWSGGCGVPRQAAGWNRYCLTATDFNTANEHLTVSADEIHFLKPGFYRITFYVLSIGASTNAVRLTQNSQAEPFHMVGVQEPATYPNSWRDTSGEVVWPFQAGDTLSIDVLNPGLYAFHHWHTGRHSRVQVTYVGPLP